MTEYHITGLSRRLNYHYKRVASQKDLPRLRGQALATAFNRVMTVARLGEKASLLKFVREAVTMTCDASSRGDDAPRSDKQRLQVLVIDDEQPVTTMLASGLTRLGFTTLVASSVQGGRALLAAHPDIGVVVSDINMPAESGLAFARELSESRPEEKALEVILMTGRSKTEDAVTAGLARVFDFIPKPFGIRQLGEVVQRALHSTCDRRLLATNSRAVSARIIEAENERQRLVGQLTASPVQLDEMTAEPAIRQRSRDDLIAIVSHELRSPLIPVIGFAEIMQQSRTVSTADLRAWASAIDANGRRLLSMIDGALKIVAFDQAIRRTRCTEVELPNFLARIVVSHGELASRRGVRIVLEAEPALSVMADACAMQIAVCHLLDNAIKASPPNETVTLSAGGSSKFVSIMVSDRGFGVPSTVVRQLGVPFLQDDTSHGRSWPGLGLGLALSTRIARAHGGDLTLRLRSGGGTAAVIDLPIALPDSLRNRATALAGQD